MFLSGSRPACVSQRPNGGGIDAEEARGFFLGEYEKALHAQDAVAELGALVRAPALMDLVEVLAQDGAGFLVGPEQELLQPGFRQDPLQGVV